MFMGMEMDDRVKRLRTARDAEILATNADQRGYPELAQQARLRGEELKAAERNQRKVADHGNKRVAKRGAKIRTASESLFLNGVFEGVLAEIVEAQSGEPELVCYLQPYKPALIRRLQEDPPTPERPWKLFMSITRELAVVGYEADVVTWRDKATLTDDELTELNMHFAINQPKEARVHLSSDGHEAGRNLLGITRLQRIDPPLAVAAFKKLSDDLPLGERSRAGGWSYVQGPESRELFEVFPETVWNERTQKEVASAARRSHEERLERLIAANPVPEQAFVAVKLFRRNQDVVVEVLSRAGGNCENCNTPAPFLRAKDGSPFLEVHHKVRLADGGLDTVENAMAVCPNCHRRLHFG